MQQSGFGLRAAHRTARQQKRKKRFFLVGFLLFGLAFSFMFYRLGVYHTEVTHISMLEEIKQAREKISLNLQQIETLMQQAELAKAELKTWQDRYAQDIPTGPKKDLTDILSQRLEEGLDPERLSYVLRHTQATSKCSEKPLIKKVAIGLEGQPRPEVVSFFDGNLTLTGQGKFAKNANGSREFWFDPQNAITITIAPREGKKHLTTGKLPFDTMVQVNDKAYHFNFRVGPKGYVFVSTTQCDYP